MSPEPATCEVHKVMMDNISDRFQDICNKLDSILKKIENAATIDAKTTADIDHLKASEAEQWKAINDLRRHVYVGIGIATILSIAFSSVLKLILK